MVNNEKDRSGRGNPEEKLILIVDDDESVWDLHNYIVSKEGFRVEKAADGKEAVEKARLLCPALIILDLMLPKRNGFAILEEIKKNPDIASIPVLILSNLGQKGDQDRALALGAKEYLVKVNHSMQEVVDKAKSYLL